MPAIVNDFLALQATFKVYEEKRAREIAGTPEPSKDANAGENAKGSAPDRLWEVSVFPEPSALEKCKSKFQYGSMPNLAQFYKSEHVITREGMDQYRGKWYDAFRLPPEMLTGKAWDIREEINKKRAQLEDWRAKNGYRSGCGCPICRAIERCNGE